MHKFTSYNVSSLGNPFSFIFKNMSFETIAQICHITRPDFVHLFPGFGIKFGLKHICDFIFLRKV
ncbi:MAG: hypothetical protein KR126chlam2_00956 [Chlamydiae bacterium]|nr:hypothetical protein [Chlamydiota bacterium]